MNHSRIGISSYFYLALIHALGVFPELLHLLFEQLTKRLLCLRHKIKTTLWEVCGSKYPNLGWEWPNLVPHLQTFTHRTLHKQTNYVNTYPTSKAWAVKKIRACQILLENPDTILFPPTSEWGDAPRRADVKAAYNIQYMVYNVVW